LLGSEVEGEEEGEGSIQPACCQNKEWIAEERQFANTTNARSKLDKNKFKVQGGKKHLKPRLIIIN